ncbi:MAG: hypothetical protein H6Q91_360 [Deltaproteobacteria bacterium]|nr:hypothetical protein [Deltaproteobacteria bacterium]
MATWLRRMFRPARSLGRSAEARDIDGAREMQTALAEAEQWAAHAAALARVLRETKAAARRLDRAHATPIERRATHRTLH